MAEVKYVDGNVHQGVIVHGPDPTNEDNVIVTPLSGAVSVPKENILPVNETPDVHLESAAAGASVTESDKSEVQKLREELAEFKRLLAGNSEG